MCGIMFSKEEITLSCVDYKFAVTCGCEQMGVKWRAYERWLVD